MDIPLLLITLAVFAGGVPVGMREYRRLAALDPGFALSEFHRKPGAVRWVLLVLTLMAAFALCVAFRRTALCRIPLWLDLSLYYWAHGLGAASLGILGGLGWSAWRREKKPDARALVLTASLCLGTLLACQFVTLRYVANRLSNIKYSGHFLLQTSSSSCAAASGANVAGLLGRRYSERDMARMMGTRVCGTSPGSIIRGLRQAGLEAGFFEINPAKASIPVPSILFINHPMLGPESHAVAAVRLLPKMDALEIWDPLNGTTTISRKVLPEVWPGRGIAVWKKTIQSSGRN